MKLRFRKRNWYGEGGWYGSIENWTRVLASFYELRMWLKHKLITKD